MTSKDVNNLIKQGDKGVAKLYKDHAKYFNIVDEWSERLTNGDLLDEYEIASCMERLTGCMMKFGTIAGALEAIKESIEQDKRVKGFNDAEKLNVPTVDKIKAEARVAINGVRKYASDFRGYFYASQSGVTTAQSRLKRLTVTKCAKGVDYCGETLVEDKENANTEKSNEW